MATVYTLKKKRNTNEMHLFKCVPANIECKCEPISMCKKMTENESHDDMFSCNNEDDTRMKIAKIGRQVCGNCASELYTTY